MSLRYGKIGVKRIFYIKKSLNFFSNWNKIVNFVSKSNVGISVMPTKI